MIRAGKFGPIRIVGNDNVTALLLNGQVQGSAFLKPGADSIHASLSGPGPVSHSAYSYGWLLAGIHNPAASGLMIGLGSGVGAVQLLANFPYMDLTVVEVDPVIVECALRTFPLIEHYLNLGRLNIVIDDASHYLVENTGTFNIGFADAYTGDSSFKVITTYMPLLRSRCEHVLVNAIDNKLCRHIGEIIRDFQSDKKPIRVVLQVTPPELFGKDLPAYNWILSTFTPDWKKVDEFTPFRDLEGPSVDYARVCWAIITANPIEPAY